MVAGTNKGSEKPPSAQLVRQFQLRFYPLAALAPHSHTPSSPGGAEAHLEEVDLHSAVAEEQDDGAAGAEPGAEVGQPCQLVPFPRRDVGACLQQVLAHVVAEVLE